MHLTMIFIIFYQAIAVGLTGAYSQSMQFTPSIRVNQRSMNAYPVYLNSANVDRWIADESTHHSQTISLIDGKDVKQFKRNETKAREISQQIPVTSMEGDVEKTLHKYSTSTLKPQYMTLSRNQTSRFFSLDTSAQALNLGISFTVPFFTIPMSSLINFGTSTSSAMSSMLDINWPTFIVTAVLIGGASLILPKLAAVIMSYATGLSDGTGSGSLSTLFSGIFGSTRGVDSASSYTEYLRRIEVAPFTSLLNQIEEAMKEYDLDSTSCMQRVVCSYVAEAEAAVSTGTDDPSQLIIKGLTRSSWLHQVFGDNALTESLETGRKGQSCMKQFPKCPFSLSSILRLLTKFVTLDT